MLFPRYGGYSHASAQMCSYWIVVSPLWGLFQCSAILIEHILWLFPRYGDYSQKQDTVMPSRVKAAESNERSTNFGF